MRLASVCRFFCLMFAAMPVLAGSALSLQTVVHFDTETSTNMPFSVGTSGAGRFTLSLSCIATPSNNVEASFGYDADNDGILELGEMAITVGWDCGAWFVRQGCDGMCIEELYASASEVKTLLLNLRFGAAGQPRRMEAAADGQPIFAAIAAVPPEWLNIRQCNRLRLTGRGLYAHGESFNINTTTDAIVIRYQ